MATFKAVWGRKLPLRTVKRSGNWTCLLTTSNRSSSTSGTPRGSEGQSHTRPSLYIRQIAATTCLVTARALLKHKPPVFSATKYCASASSRSPHPETIDAAINNISSRSYITISVKPTCPTFGQSKQEQGNIPGWHLTRGCCPWQGKLRNMTGTSCVDTPS